MFSPPLSSSPPQPSHSIISLGPAPSHYRRVHLQPHTRLQCICIVFLLAEAEMVICGFRGKLRVGTTSCLTTAYGSCQFRVLPLCSNSGSQPGNVTDLFAFGPAGVCQKTVPVHSSPKTTCFFSVNIVVKQTIACCFSLFSIFMLSLAERCITHERQTGQKCTQEIIFIFPSHSREEAK